VILRDVGDVLHAEGHTLLGAVRTGAEADGSAPAIFYVVVDVVRR